MQRNKRRYAVASLIPTRACVPPMESDFAVRCFHLSHVGRRIQDGMSS